MVLVVPVVLGVPSVAPKKESYTEIDTYYYTPSTIVRLYGFFVSFSSLTQQGFPKQAVLPLVLLLERKLGIFLVLPMALPLRAPFRPRTGPLLGPLQVLLAKYSCERRKLIVDGATFSFYLISSIPLSIDKASCLYI